MSPDERAAIEARHRRWFDGLSNGTYTANATTDRWEDIGDLLVALGEAEQALERERASMVMCSDDECDRLHWHVALAATGGAEGG